MVKIDKYIEDNKLEKDVQMILQIHDEVIFEVKEKILKDDKFEKDMYKIIADLVSDEQTKDLAILVETCTGDNWGELK